MRIDCRRAAAAAALTFACTVWHSAPAPAQTVEITAESVAVRIDLAGRQRMLAERMAKSLCNARSNVNAASNVARLQKAMELFDTTHRGFVAGSAELNLFAENDASVKKAHRNVDVMWTALRGIYEDALGGAFVTEEAFAQAMDLTLELRKRANDMVAQLRSAYSSDLGTGGFGDAILIDLYGRQRMLSQKLAKEVCLVARGHELDRTLDELAKTLDTFEASLTAFIEGMPIAGVPVPPSEAIAEQLAVAKAEWDPIRLTAATLVSGGAVTLSDLAIFADGADRFLVEMNKAVKLLAAHEGANGS